MSSAVKFKPAVEEILCKAGEGETITREEALLLADVEGEEFSSLLRAARELADRHKGKTITYSPKVFIPLTNLCRDYCGYCTFRKDPGDVGAKTLTPDEVLEVVNRGAELGCKEALFSLGDRPEALFAEAREELRRLGFRRTLDYLAAVCRLVIEKSSLLPHSNPGLMGPRDLRRLREVNVSLGLMLESVSPRLLETGGAHDRAPDKVPSRRLRTLEEAGRLNIPFTTGILIGIGETWTERVDSLLAIARLHRRYGHIQEVIIQNFRAKPTIPMRHRPDPTLEDFLRTIAVARLILGGEMNLQAPPNLTPDTYPTLISAGINDWGGISPLTQDYINPEAPWPHLRELYERTAGCGYQVRERLAIYPEYIARKQMYLTPVLRPNVERLCGQDGYAKEEAAWTADSQRGGRDARVV
ncbi:MAG: 7,8-didemethyl-8-hydroxy-5-deazariboflavin synthase CofG [Candidatus Tectomicrobia bacterium]|uniref:7,8-didemethyl-8-hydroxy-5-deazariboflavin synthase n=1 Tax=Tectimicrobiota bacterium TaxID=2528274 RepID=A0A932M1G4_UNCTE|nr:7,8-didemethyl-8-hydroxy-5-deazariboflavin synthase CofG [Candidatus Tectomicrobia bacterium]